MSSGALHPTHGSSNLHFMQVTAPDNEVPVFEPGMQKDVTELEECVCDGKTESRAERSAGDC